MYQVTVRGFLDKELAESLATHLRSDGSGDASLTVGVSEQVASPIASDERVTAVREALMSALPAKNMGVVTYTVVARALEDPIVVRALAPTYAEAERLVRDTLDTEGHDEDCVRRCLRNDCRDDHHCEKCAEDVDDGG